MKPAKSFARIGFGTYRVAIGNASHEAALKKALKNGITLVDTSANYTDGDSERLIGKVVFDLQCRDTITLVSKFGYIQGENMERQKQGLTFAETVEYHDDCYHCIHPDFMRDQLQRSLERLQTTYLDVYLLHNPEYYLLLNVKKKADQKKHQEEMLRRISEAFFALEQEVKKGTILSYGISSNSFGKPNDDVHFLPYEPLIILAQEAAKKAGNVSHSFSTIQMPANLIEIAGLSGCGPWARKNNLHVLINRPLNAFDEKGMWRLSSCSPVKNYSQETTKLAAELPPHCRLVLEELEEGRAQIQSPSHYEHILYNYILPHLQSMKLTRTQSTQVQQYLTLFGRQIAHNVSEHTRNYLLTKEYDPVEPLEEYALKFLLKYPFVSCVLLGMRKELYVDTALKVLRETK